MSRATVAQSWPLANGGTVILTVIHPEPSVKAVTLLSPIIEAIEAYQAAIEAGDE